MKELTWDRLLAAVAGDDAAFRLRARLAPAGGPGDKVFPPTYATEDRSPTKYAVETRRVNGEDVPTVLLDSVASQANRMELALLEAWEDGLLEVPVIYTSFDEVEGLEDLGRITTFEAPHRVADALLRDSLLDGTPFRASDMGMAITEASTRAATPIFVHCPSALVFGLWDSTGPKGGLGAKYPRALTSEIVGMGYRDGVKTSSRIDPAQIENVPVYASAEFEGDWTTDAAHAVGGPKKPAKHGKGEHAGKPSALNHGNVTPSIDSKAGGVTIDYAMQTTVLSLPALRRLRFPNRSDGAVIPRADRAAAQNAARATLAALGLAAIVLQRRHGYDLRSRCVLVPDGEAPLTLLPASGGDGEAFTLTAAQACNLVSQGMAASAEHGLGWHLDPVILEPAPKLVGLIQHSRAKSAREGAAAEDA